jgi:uncharacterized protein (DUF1697 family)
MQEYIAFLRGINVSGQKLIKMDALRKVLTDAGFEDVRTYIQSGNILFNALKADSELLISRIEDLVEKHFGFRTDVILRRKIDIESILNSLQISASQCEEVKKYYITFLKEEIPEPIGVPMFSKNQDVEIIYHNNKDFVSVSTLVKGNYGFPNAFIEKLTRIPATTRNPHTLGKILEL